MASTGQSLLAADARESFRRGERVSWPSADVQRTVADALRVEQVGALPFAHIRELVAHLKPRVPAFMVPRYVEFMAALPKTPTQKVLKAELRKDSLNPRTWDSARGGFLT